MAEGSPSTNQLFIPSPSAARGVATPTQQGYLWGVPMLDLKTGWTGIALALGLLLVLSGCASRKVNWGERVGSYSFDQAVIELGPPDKQAELTDGTRVADWMTHRGGYRRTTVGPYHAYGYQGYARTTDYYVPDRFLRLVFDPEGNLAEWKRLAR